MSIQNGQPISKVNDNTTIHVGSKYEPPCVENSSNSSNLQTANLLTANQIYAKRKQRIKLENEQREQREQRRAVYSWTYTKIMIKDIFRRLEYNINEDLNEDPYRMWIWVYTIHGRFINIINKYLCDQLKIVVDREDYPIDDEKTNDDRRYDKDGWLVKRGDFYFYMESITQTLAKKGFTVKVSCDKTNGKIYIYVKNQRYIKNKRYNDKRNCSIM